LQNKDDNNKNAEKSEENNQADKEINPLAIFDNFLKQMNDLNELMALGPFTSLINDPKVGLSLLVEHGNLLSRYQNFSSKFLSKIVDAYFKALNKVSESLEKDRNADTRKLIINTFEDVFSSMYESEDFSKDYNNLITSIIDVNNNYQRFLELNAFPLKQQFTKEEKELLFYNLYEIKKLSLEIKNKLEEKNDDE
jgi:hypothetical protein